MKRGLFASGCPLEQEMVHPEVQEHVQRAPYQRCLIGHKGKRPVEFIDAHVFGRSVFELEVVVIITVTSTRMRYGVPDASEVRFDPVLAQIGPFDRQDLLYAFVAFFPVFDAVFQDFLYDAVYGFVPVLEYRIVLGYQRRDDCFCFPVASRFLSLLADTFMSLRV